MFHTDEDFFFLDIYNIRQNLKLCACLVCASAMCKFCANVLSNLHRCSTASSYFMWIFCVQYSTPCSNFPVEIGELGNFRREETLQLQFALAAHSWLTS